MASHRIHIVSIDVDASLAAVEHVEGLGFEAEVLPGVDVDNITAPDLGPYHLSLGNIARKYTGGDIEQAMEHQEFYQSLYRRQKIAILRAMRYSTHVVGAGTIMQDDYRFPGTPDIGDQPLVAWAGDRWPGHYCPKAFTFNEDIGKLLVDAWSDERRNACDGWLPILRKHKVEPTWQ